MILERNPSYHGKIGIVEGVLRWGNDGPSPWYGTVTLVEEHGRDYLTFLRPDGAVWTEFDRAK
jgi:hypothetical protein